MKYIRLIIFGLVFVASYSFAQKPPKIFLNCSQARCYDDFVRTELSFFDFVRDMGEADIQIMFQTQGTGAGGRKYFVNFIGQKEFENIKKQLSELHNKLGNYALINHLLDCFSSRAKSNKNSWQTAFYEGLLNDEDFINGNFK